jgi:transposase
MEYIAFDAHKRYTLASVARPDGGLVREQRIPHERGALQQFLERCEQGSAVAVETIGNWYWIVDEIEAAGCVPKLVHARKAKLMMGELNKTDTLDVRGLNRLQRAGTRPTVWIPPGELRDQRDLPRTRMVLVRQRTPLKNRIHATLAKYALHDIEVSDLFGVRGRAGPSCGSASISCRPTRRTRPSACSSRLRVWTTRCAGSSNGSRPCSN